MGSNDNPSISEARALVRMALERIINIELVQHEKLDGFRENTLKLFWNMWLDEDRNPDELHPICHSWDEQNMLDEIVELTNNLFEQHGDVDDMTVYWNDPQWSAMADLAQQALSLSAWE